MPPTTKYIRPWYVEIDRQLKLSQRHSSNCAHQISLKYLKDFFKEFKEEKKFLFHVFNLGHNHPAQASSIDVDMVEFMRHLNKTGALSNTAVVLFGDHGDRTADFRRTMQGKLEERLPFVSITLPSWFRKKFPAEFANLNRNSEILTAHYDLHATNKHLLTFPYLPEEKHEFGRSLFSDILSLNRKCHQAGVEDTWCPCINYETVDSQSANVTSIAKQVVEHFNDYVKMNPVVKENCMQLQLKEILRARRVTTSEHVEHFVETKKNKECDECGMHFNKTAAFKKSKYELQIEVSPSGGQYEFLVDVHFGNNTIDTGPDFLTQVSRINIYGNQPKCISREFPYHRPYCYCKDYHKNRKNKNA